MASPTELAQQRLAAIADLEQQVATAATEAQRQLYEELLSRLSDIHADPTLLPGLLAQYQATILAPVVYAYGQAMLQLPELNVAYFQALDVAGYQQLKKPLTDFLTARLGVDATGAIVPGGYLDLMAGNTAVRQQVLSWAYAQQASGTGLQAYREGLKQLVLGGDKPAEGLVSQMLRESSDDFNRNDRALQSISAKELGLQAYLYQGGLIDSSRPFCKVRNGKCFTDFEVRRFGTKADTYGGYTNKSQGLFSGKSEPYDPFTDLGGYSCRHGLHAVPNLVALRMREDLAENDKGELVIR
jgi:hypothetical protein